MNPSPPLAEAWSVVHVARATEPADLVVRRCRLVNVYSGEVHSADVAVRAGRIAAIRPDYPGTTRQEVEGGGRLLLPGLVATLEAPKPPAPEALHAAMAQGVTSLVVDTTGSGPCELAWAGPQRLWRSARMGVPTRLAATSVAAPTFEAARTLVRQGLFAFPVPGGDGLRPLLAAWVRQRLDARGLCLGRISEPDWAATLWAGVDAARSAGLGPVEACALATLHPAIAFGLDAWIGSVAPGRWADFCLVDDWSQPKPSQVFLGGVAVG